MDSDTSTEGEGDQGFQPVCELELEEKKQKERTAYLQERLNNAKTVAYRLKSNQSEFERNNLDARKAQEALDFTKYRALCLASRRNELENQLNHETQQLAEIQRVENITWPKGFPGNSIVLYGDGYIETLTDEQKPRVPFSL